MTFNVQRQNNTNNFNISAYLKYALKSNSSSKDSSILYAKKGEPSYLQEMDTDNDGNITMEEFRQYCKENNISTNDMAKMLELRMAYRMSKDVTDLIGKNKKEDKKENNELTFGDLELIYAEENDGKYDENMDSDSDLRVSYKEYLRYCEQNARTKNKSSDTKIQENNNSKFMTVSYGKITNAYTKVETEEPEGKVESIV